MWCFCPGLEGISNRSAIYLILVVLLSDLSEAWVIEDMHELAGRGIQGKVSSDSEEAAQGTFSLIWFLSLIFQYRKDLIALSQCGLLLFCDNLWICMHWSLISESYTYQLSIKAFLLFI